MADPLAATKTEAVGVFDNAQEMHLTIEELEISGFARHQISMRGSDAAVKTTFGTTQVASGALGDNPQTPRSAIVGREEVGIAQGVLIGSGAWVGAAFAMLATNGLQTGGSIAITLLATLVGAGIGAVLARYLASNYQRFFQKQANKTGLLLWVETPDASAESNAKRILLKHGARDIHIHTIANVA